MDKRALFKLISFYSLIMGIIGLILFVGFFVLQQNNNPSPIPTITTPVVPTISLAPTDAINADLEDIVVCTMDAKLCPDGSYVGRTGPNCEFAACPGEK